MLTSGFVFRVHCYVQHSSQVAVPRQRRRQGRREIVMSDSYSKNSQQVKTRPIVGARETNRHPNNSSLSKLLKANEKDPSKLLEQLVQSRNRMSKQLSDANKYISYLERKLEDGNYAMHEAFRVTEKVLDELDALSCLTVAVAASLKFGVDQDETIIKLSSLQKRISLAQESLSKERNVISMHCPRKIPVSWIGVAEDVRVMGDFDGWTRGKELCADEISEHVITEFTGVLELLPGKYEIKFLVNNEWKLASSWPVVTNSSGVENNLLVVE